jgi:hypothetical protein
MPSMQRANPLRNTENYLMKKNLIAWLLFAASEALSTPASAAMGYRAAPVHVPHGGAHGEGARANAVGEARVRMYGGVKYAVSKMDCGVRFDATRTQVSHEWSRFGSRRA